MELRSRWRHFWAQRSRFRLTLAVICLVAALVIVGFIYVPDLWLARGGAALQAAGMYILSHGSRSLLFAADGVLLVFAVLLVVLPRRRSHSYWVSRPSAIAPISVYVDAENQLQKSELVRPFVGYLRKYLSEHLKGQRADLLYFADAAQPAHRPTYKELYRFGFRPIDVPHVPFENEEVKDAVDMELALHAFDRALTGGQRQHFIIVTGDRDFLPLVFRLHSFGHIISLWAADPPPAYRAVQNFLDNVEIFDLNEVFPPDLRASKSDGIVPTTGSPALKRQPARRRQKRGGIVVARRTHNPTTLAVGHGEHATISEGILYTLDVIRHLDSSPGSAADHARLLPIRVGAMQGNFLKRLGYEGGTRIECWVEELVALGVIRTESPGTLIAQGYTDPMLAASQMEMFVSDIASAALRLANERQDGTITYLDISTHMGESVAMDSTGIPNPLRALVIKTPG